MDKIEIAKIINTHALKGELKVELYTDFPFERFKENQKVFIRNDELIVKSFRMYKNYGYVKFINYNNINDVEKFKNEIISIEKKYINLKDNEFYFFQLKGLEVKNKDIKLGKVIDIIKGNAQNVLKVQKNDNNTFYVPYVDFFIKEINLKDGYILINVIKGLLWR